MTIRHDFVHKTTTATPFNTRGDISSFKKSSKMSIPSPNLPEHLFTKTTTIPLLAGETCLLPEDPPYELWVVHKVGLISRYHESLKAADAARLDLENKYKNLQSQYHRLELEMEKTTDGHRSKLDEEIFRSDVLRLQLEVAQGEVAEHKDAMNTLAEKLQHSSQQADALACDLERTQSEVAHKNTEIAALGSLIAEKDSVIDHLERTLHIHKTELRKRKDMECQEFEFKATILSQLEVIVDLNRHLEAQQQRTSQQIEHLEREFSAVVSEREAASLEVQRLKAVHEGHEAYIEKLRLEKQNLEGDIGALIDMSVESEAIRTGCAEENKRLNDQVAILDRDLGAIREVLTDQLSGLQPDFGNLPFVLNRLSRRNPKRRCRKGVTEASGT